MMIVYFYEGDFLSFFYRLIYLTGHEGNAIPFELCVSLFFRLLIQSSIGHVSDMYDDVHMGRRAKKRLLIFIIA